MKNEPPKRGLTAKCRITEVYDGDTITVEVMVPVRVRLLDCWAPEIRTKNQTEKKLGLESKSNLKELAEGKEGIIHLPWEDARRLDDTLTFGRVLADVWVDGDSLSEMQVLGGFATDTK